MKKILYTLTGLLIGGSLLMAFSPVAEALSVFQTSQGGSGTSTPSGILYGDNGATSHLNTVALGAGCTFITGTLSCSGTGDTFAYPFPNNATSTGLTFSGGFVSNGSTTIPSVGSGLVGANNGLLYGFASSSLFGYIPLNPTRNINTSAPLGGGGNLSSDLTLTCATCGTASFSGTIGQVGYFTGANTSAGTSTINIGTNMHVAVGGTTGTFPFLTLGTSTSAIAGGNVDALYIQANAGTDAEIDLNNQTPGVGAYFKDVGNSDFVSFEMTGTNSADWKMGLFGGTSWNLSDNGTNVLNFAKGLAANTFNVTGTPTALKIGIASTSPFAEFSIQAASFSTNQILFAIGSSTANSTSTLLAIDNSGHFNYKAASSTCGTGCTNIVGDDDGGTVTTGTAVSSVTVNFGAAWRQTPVCTVTDSSTSVSADISAISTTAFTVGLSIGLTGTIYYQCANFQ